MKQESLITVEGFEKIQAELKYLIQTERKNLKTAIAEARKLGDLKENAEYHAAKEKQALVEGRVAQLQAIIASARIIDTSTIKSENIVFGATVTLLNVETDESVVTRL